MDIYNLGVKALKIGHKRRSYKEKKDKLDHIKIKSSMGEKQQQMVSVIDINTS